MTRAKGIIKRSTFQRMAPIVIGFLGIVLMAGCGVDQSPMASSDEEMLAPAAEGQMFLVLTSDTAERAGKKIKNKGRKIKDHFNHKGGDLEIVEEYDEDDLEELFGEDWDDDSDDDSDDDDDWDDDDFDRNFKFKVSKKALPKDAEVEISMEVWGNKASEIVVGFTPSGLHFEKDCELEIELGGAWVDLTEEQIDALHLSADGVTEEAEIKKLKIDDDGNLEIKIKIPGFSRYSMGGGD